MRALLATALALSSTASFGGQGTARYVLASTPTLELFSEDILFYKSFDDDSPAADMAVGEAKPTAVRGRLRLR
jgi:hypothetical protein